MRIIRPILVLPVRLVGLLTRLVVIVPLRASFALLGFSVRTAGRTTRLAVRSSLAAFVAGLGLGWALGTPTGRRLLADLGASIRRDQPLSDAELAERVAAELRGSARTWHLVQPEVTVVAGAVTLTGEVPHDQGRSDLVAVASGVPGASGVIDQLTVTDADPGADPTGVPGTTG